MPEPMRLLYEGTEDGEPCEVIGVWPDGKLKVVWECAPGHVGRWTPREFARWFCWVGAADGHERPDDWIAPGDTEALVAAARRLTASAGTQERP